MAVDGGTVELTFKARLDRLEADMAQAKSKVSRAADDMGDDAHSRLSKKLGSLGATVGKAAVLGIGAAAVGIGAVLKGAFNAAEESRKVGAQTAAVITSTGGAANVSADHVGKYADKLAALTGIDDEMIASGQNLLLTFTNVRNEVGKGNDIFDQGTKAALNMSVALGTDMKSASMLVGKALNDPIAGMTALTRSGIQFTDQQKSQVKAMVAAGDTLGAQKIILKELETQFAGSAEAAASPMARLKVVVGNLQEELGARLLPVVGKVATVLANTLPGAIDKASGLIGGFFSIIAKGQFTGFKAMGMEEDAPIIAKMFKIRDAAIGLFNILGKGDFSSAFRRAFNVEEDAPIVVKLLAIRATVIDVVQTAVAFVQANWPKIQETISSVLSTVVAVVAGVVDVVLTIWNNFGSQIMSQVQASFSAIAAIVGGAMDIIQGIVKVVTSIIHSDWSGAWEGIKQVLAGAWDAIKALVSFGMDTIQNLLSVGMEIAKSAFLAAWNGMIDFVSGIPGRILGALGNLGSLLISAGEDLIRGLLRGIGNMAGAAKDAAMNVVHGAVNAVKGFLGIGSPSKLFMGFGVNVGEGLAIGMQRSVGLVAGAGDMLSSAASGFSSSGAIGGLAHSGDSDGGGSAPKGHTYNVGPFYVKENDLPTEIPRRLRTVNHLWQ